MVTDKKEIINKIDTERKSRVYYLTGGRTLPFKQLQERTKPIRTIYWHNQETGQNELLRYSERHASPFEADQDGTYLASRIFFEQGILRASAQNLALQKFLAFHPDNEANGGRVFYEYDADKVAEEATAHIDAEVDALIAVKELNFEELESLMYNLSDVNAFETPTKQLQRDAYISAKKQPGAVLEIIKSEHCRLKGFAGKALYEKVLIVEGRGDRIVKWGHGKNMQVMVVPTDKSNADGLADFFKTDKGQAVLDKVIEKLG